MNFLEGVAAVMEAQSGSIYVTPSYTFHRLSTLKANCKAEVSVRNNSDCTS